MHVIRKHCIARDIRRLVVLDSPYVFLFCFYLAIGVYKSMRASRDDIDGMERIRQLGNVQVQVLHFKFHRNKAYPHAILRLKTNSLKG
jgi:hypothetical protein